MLPLMIAFIHSRKLLVLRQSDHTGANLAPMNDRLIPLFQQDLILEYLALDLLGPVIGVANAIRRTKVLQRLLDAILNVVVLALKLLAAEDLVP